MDLGRGRLYRGPPEMDCPLANRTVPDSRCTRVGCEPLDRVRCLGVPPSPPPAHAVAGPPPRTTGSAAGAGPSWLHRDVSAPGPSPLMPHSAPTAALRARAATAPR